MPAWQIAGVPEPAPLTSAFTISLGPAEEMGRSARTHADLPLLKLKLTGEGDLDRVGAVREGAPNARLIVDANEAWNPRQYAQLVPELARLGVELIEQPFPADRDSALADLPHDVPVCADESCHTSADLPGLAGRYDAVNIKLDKTGGLTEALRLLATAASEGFQVMVGCMVGTSLGVAPATLLGHAARWVDLDPPLLLADDRVPGVRYEGATIVEVPRELWG
jgi:L-alanine-DL-glutamate epimerase-like enolase superfamily enzyme